MSKDEKLNKLLGYDVNELDEHDPQVDYPDTVAGRVLHIDGDFLAYHVSFDNETPFADMIHNHDVAVEILRLSAGAERTLLHLTASEGCKGSRYEIAIQSAYQINRVDKEKPKMLDAIKKWMEDSRGALNHINQEADDGLCQALWSAHAAGTPELAVLVSKDKDLWMCTGWHLDWDEKTLEYVDGFGYTSLDRSKSTPKIRGKGTKYFWSQMLTGDAADSIKGLPKVSGDVLNKIKPTKAITKALGIVNGDVTATAKQMDKALDTLSERSPGACGAVLASTIIERLHNDRQAYTVVSNMYKWYGENIGFVHWENDKPVPWKDVFLSEAQLLWMRREEGDNDVEIFFEECK
jgi:hypothetical protein